jgi:hypothetical protein
MTQENGSKRHNAAHLFEFALERPERFVVKRAHAIDDAVETGRAASLNTEMENETKKTAIFGIRGIATTHLADLCDGAVDTKHTRKCCQAWGDRTNTHDSFGWSFMSRSRSSTNCAPFVPAIAYCRASNEAAK